MMNSLELNGNQIDLTPIDALLKNANPEDSAKAMEMAREIITYISESIMYLFKKRNETMSLIARSKSHGAPILQLERELFLLLKASQSADAITSPKMARNLMYFLMSCGKEIQRGILDRDSVFIKEDISKEILRQNLLQLTDLVADNYQNYGNDFGATKFTKDYEESRIVQEAYGCQTKDLALDLGCADGRISKILSQQLGFKEVKGVDISSKFLDIARKDSHRGEDYQTGDISKGIRTDKIADNSVDFLVSNFGAASEVHEDILSQVQRVLKPDGKAFLTFYNKDCINHGRRQPSETSIGGVLNVESNLLEVPIIYNDQDNNMQGKVFKVFAKPYSSIDIQQRAKSLGLTANIESYPSMLNIASPMLFDVPQMVKRISQREKAHSKVGPYMGFYITAVVTK